MSAIKSYTQLMRVDTEANLLAMTPSDGTVAYAHDTHRGYAYKRTGDPLTSGWTRITDKVQLDALQSLLQSNIDGKANLSHTHAQSDVTNLVSDLAGKEPYITAGTSSQYYRGDKTMQTLNKGAVGLGNVDNTSDLNKPVSTAQQTAIDKKTAVFVYDQGVQITSGTPQTGDTIIWHDQTTVSGGNANFYITSDRTNSGTPICSSIRNGTVDAAIIDSTGATARGDSTITSNKQVTVPITKQAISGVTVLGINVIGTITQSAAPNGTVVKLYAIGVKA